LLRAYVGNTRQRLVQLRITPRQSVHAASILDGRLSHEVGRTACGPSRGVAKNTCTVKVPHLLVAPREDHDAGTSPKLSDTNLRSCD
jgi:hypothetical protein